MPFTVSTVTGSYETATGAPAQGAVEFSLNADIQNGSVTLGKGTSAVAHLDASGNVSQQLVSTLDVGTTSPVSIPLWRVDERVAGCSESTFYIAVPSGGVSVSLQSLSPFVNGPPVLA